MKTNPLVTIKKRQKLFRSLTGITIEKFNELLKQVTPLYEAAEAKRLFKSKKIRKQGGGRQKDLDLPNQLLMLLMYYRIYVSQEFLGLIFGLHNCNVSRQLTYLQPQLAKIFRRPAQRVKLSEEELTEEQLLNIFILDATEQQIRRSKKQQKKFYSGKKKKPKGKELTLEQKQFNRELSKQRIKIEHTIGRMKVFQILSQRYRNDLAGHSLVFKNIAGLHNLMYA